MNPLALLLLAAAAGGGRMPGMSGGGAPIKLDNVLEQLHGAVNTDVYKRQNLYFIIIIY